MINDPITNTIVDMMVEAQRASNAGSHAASDQLQQKITETIQEANLRGEINPAKFHHAVSRNIVQRYSPHLSEILALGKVLPKDA